MEVKSNIMYIIATEETSDRELITISFFILLPLRALIMGFCLIRVTSPSVCDQHHFAELCMLMGWVPLLLLVYNPAPSSMQAVFLKHCNHKRVVLAKAPMILEYLLFS